MGQEGSHRGQETANSARSTGEVGPRAEVDHRAAGVISCGCDNLQHNPKSTQMGFR